MYEGMIYDLYKRDNSGEHIAARYKISQRTDAILNVVVSEDKPDAKEQIVIKCSMVSGRFIVDVIDVATLSENEEICGAVATGSISIPLRGSQKEDSR